MGANEPGCQIPAERAMSMNRNNRGFSLIELLVVTAIFMIVIIISSDAFNVIRRNAYTQSRLAQSNIDGVTGLEILRSDLEAAGFGLFWSMPTDSNGNIVNISYGDPADGEADDNPPQNAYNLTGGVPPAVQSGNDTFLNDDTLQLNGTDYLVLRGTTLAHNAASQKWSYMTRQLVFATISSATPSAFPLHVNSWSSGNLTLQDKVVVITGAQDPDPSNHRKLVTNSGVFFTKFTEPNLSNFQPPLPSMPAVPHPLIVDSPAYFIYGVHTADGTSNGEKLRMPYNRADYYVRRPNAGVNRVPQRCAPGTGILFKAVAGHANGVQTEYPLLDCVADFQVVYSLDTGDVSASGLDSMTPADIRNRLKNIQVYILTHAGGRDTGYSYPDQSTGVGPGNGITSGTGSTRTFTQFSSSSKNYRWKVYRITVTPKNILPAQR